MTDQHVSTDDHSAVVEVEGEDAFDRAKTILDALTPGLEGDVTYIKVEARATPTDADNEVAEKPADADADADADDEAEQTGKTPGSREHLTEHDRAREMLGQAQTSKHAMLAYVAAADEPVTSTQLREFIRDHTDYAPTSVSATLSDLYRGKLLDRDPLTEQQRGGKTYEYSITEWGRDELERKAPYHTAGDGLDPAHTEDGVLEYGT